MEHSQAKLRDERYWIATTRAESLIVLGDKSGEELLTEALARELSRCRAASANVGTSKIVRPPRRRSATCPSPQREARDAFWLR